MSAESPRLSDRLLKAIGRVAATWSGIEAALEIAILGLFKLDFSRGLVLTANIGFQSRLSLLRILANGGAITDQTEARNCLDLLSRIEGAYADRNTIIHACWGPAKKPGHARRVYVRARGKTLRTPSEDVPETEVEGIADRLEDLAGDLSHLLDRLDLWAAADFDPINSDARTTG